MRNPPPTFSRARAIALTNWRIAAKDRRTPIAVLVLPVLVMIVVGTVFGVDDRDPVGLVDRDHGARARELRSFMEGSNLRVRTFDNEDDMRAALRRARVLAGVVVPPRYTEDIGSGRQADVRVVSQPGRSESVALRAQVGRVVAQQGFSVLAERATGRPFAVRGQGSFTSRYGRAPNDVSPFSYTAPSNLVLFSLITSLVFGSGLVASRRLGTLQRMLATPTPARAIVLGYAMTAFVVALVQATGLLVIGSLFFRVHWGDPAAVAILLLLLAVVGASMNLIMGTVARTPEQAVAAAVPLGIAIGMLGGCMWPLEVVSPGMRAIGHLTPNAWAMDAWIRLVFVRVGLSGVTRQLLMLALFAAVLFPLATWRLRRVVAHAG
ncbi:MAG: linearmycin/streptolysin transport system permease protein [Actinomycetota bacterium]